MTTSLSPEVILALNLVTDMIDTRRWGAKVRVFGYMLRRQLVEPEGVQVSYRTLAEAIHCEERWAARLLTALVEDRVISLVRRGAGRRASRYRVNPNVDQWRSVALTIPVEAAMWRLRSAGLGQARHLTRMWPDLQPLHGLTAVPNDLLGLYGAALDTGSAAPWRGTSDPESPAVMALIRDLSDKVEALNAALRGSERGIGPAVVPRHSAALDPADAPDAPCTSEIASLSLGREREGGYAEERRTVAAAIATATGGGAVWGRALDQVDELLRCAPAEQLAAWCVDEAHRHRDRPLTALGLVALLEARVVAGDMDAGAAVSPELVANLRRQVLTMLEVDDLELAAQWLNELRGADAQAAAELVAADPRLEQLEATPVEG